MFPIIKTRALCRPFKYDTCPILGITALLYSSVYKHRSVLNHSTRISFLDLISIGHFLMTIWGRLAENCSMFFFHPSRSPNVAFIEEKPIVIF